MWATLSLASWRTPISVSAAERPVPKVAQDSEAAKPQVSLQVPEGSGCKEPPASRGLVASALLQPSLFLETASLKLLGFSSLLVFYYYYYYYCRRSWVAGMCVKDKAPSSTFVQGARPSLPGNLHKLPFFIFQLEYSSVISKKMPAQPSLCKHCNHHSISATLSRELI